MLESEQRIIAFYRDEFLKIRKEMKKGAEQDDDVVGYMGAGNNVDVDKDVEELNSVGEISELGKGVQQDGHVIAEVGKGGEEDDVFGDVGGAFEGGKGDEQDDTVGDGDAAFEGGKGEKQDDAVGDGDATFEGGNGDDQEDGVGSDGMVVGDVAFESGKGDEQEDAVGDFGKGFEQRIDSDCVVVVNAAFEGGNGDEQEDAAVGETGTGSDQGVGRVGDAAFEGDMVEHAGYYEEMKMDPHASPFTVQNMHSELIPQQDDGYSYGVFLMKYAELILTGVKTSWKSVLGQKDIKDIRKAIAIDIYTNGQLCNSL
ncbi:hypothetical protein Dsin_026879 [Dipteronia sinensis]|uniref:Ubiquitin-like protease family profile domain-containing protein n=1 Tax=Dipteronia sinensis TaxID=43782 RepID=A0AAD9ZZI8_9ROSI|nr:hypothetical protein Dsin_026879 [Dipteronia sinensis]